MSSALIPAWCQLHSAITLWTTRAAQKVKNVSPYQDNKETEYTRSGTYLCLLFHIVAFDIKTLVIPWHQFVNSLFIPCGRLVIQTASFRSSSFAERLPAKCFILETVKSLTVPGPDCTEDARRCPNGIAHSARFVSAGQYADVHCRAAEQSHAWACL